MIHSEMIYVLMLWVYTTQYLPDYMQSQSKKLNFNITIQNSGLNNFDLTVLSFQQENKKMYYFRIFLQYDC